MANKHKPYPGGEGMLDGPARARRADVAADPCRRAAGGPRLPGWSPPRYFLAIADIVAPEPSVVLGPPSGIGLDPVASETCWAQRVRPWRSGRRTCTLGRMLSGDGNRAPTSANRMVQKKVGRRCSLRTTAPKKRATPLDVHLFSDNNLVAFVFSVS